ncbi:MAG: sugar transferase, partial [Planctomycetes bacterium]|nr:sugar transferase [Planctomycetota bacterium]
GGAIWVVLVDGRIAAAQRLASRTCQTAGLPVRYTLHHYPTTPTIAAGRDSIDEDSPGSPRPLEPCFEAPSPLWKRLLDVAGAGLGLLLTAPLFAAAAVLVKLDSAGPVLFAQQRSGRLGRSFTIYKFRSMLADAEQRKQELMSLNEQDGPAFKIEHDPRVTRVGRVLRGTSLDELPQLWNVLLGQMSLVGPRPLPVTEAERCRGWQRRRSDVTPGLTCFWQVKDRRTKISFDDWVRMDLRYIRERSLWTDLKLILQTVAFVLRRRGV